MHTRPLDLVELAHLHAGVPRRLARLAALGAALLVTGLGLAGCQSPAKQGAPLGAAQEAAIAANVLRAPPTIGQPMSVNFDNKITLLGYDMRGKPRKGESFELTLYFRVDQPIEGDWKVFFHFEIPDDPATPQQDGKRLTMDHYGVDNLYPVSQWKKGEIIRDKVTVRVPAGWRSGETSIWVGFFDWGALEKAGEDRRLPIVPATRTHRKPAPNRFLLTKVSPV